MFQDLRFGLRLFRKHPLPVGLATVGLALAIGVVTAVFSLVNATMLRPFQMDEPSSVSSVEAALADRARVSTTALTESGPERDVLFVSGGYLEALGGRLALGRSLTPEDDLPSASPVVVVSHDLWKSDLAADPAAVGTRLWVNGAPAIVVGVLQKGFSGPVRQKPSLWATFAACDDLLGVAQSYTINGRTPASMQGEPFAPTSRTLVEVLARLAPGVPTATAEGNLTTLVHRAEANAPDADPTSKPTVLRLFSAASPIDGPRASESYLAIAAILGLVGLVLAVACADTANLLLAAAATRTREIGVRLALGATPRRLLMQMVSESLLLGLTAGVLGFMFALWFSPLLSVMVGMDGVNVTPDVRVLTFAIIVAAACGLGAGIAPARFGARGSLFAALQSQGGAAGRASVPSRLRTSFIGLQAAVSMVLLVAGALLARTAIHMTRTDPGFDVDRVLTASVTTLEEGFDEPAYFRRALDAVRAIPSVDGVGLIQRRPFGDTIETIPLTLPRETYALYMNRTDAGFFRAAGLLLLRGRLFTTEEVAAGAAVAVIGEDVARRFFSGADPIGQPLSNLPLSGSLVEDRSATIIGLVAEALLNRAHAEGFGNVHRPIRQVADTPKVRGFMPPPTLVVRTSSPVAASREVEEVLRLLDTRVRPTTWILKDAVETFVGDKRMLAWLAVPMASLALILASLGVYGVTAFVVSRRTQEVSVRMALGASAPDVMRLLVHDGLRPVLIGLGVGLAVAIGAGRVFASLFTGISPNDPVAIGIAMVTLLVAALVAVVIPARRAARVDPATILRES